jgi:hypothetical protein
MIASSLKGVSQITPSDKKGLETVTEKANLIKSSNSPFKTKLSSYLTNISLTSTFNQGENAEANINYTTNADSTFVIGGFVNQKIGKNINEVNPFSFTDGLGSGTTVGLNIKFVLFNARSFHRFTEAAKIYADQNKIDYRSVTLNSLQSDYNAKGVNNYGLTESDIQKLRKNKYHAPLFLKLKVAFTKTTFSFTKDSITLKKIKKNYLTPDLEFSVGRAMGIKSYLALSYAYSESYNVADDITFTTPFGSTTNLYSQTLAFGSPDMNTDNKLSAQWSKLLGDSGRIGISPTLTYGVTSKKVAITLPIYFIKGLTKDGKPNGLQGGVQLGYITNTNTSWANFKDGFGAQLIIGVPFDLFSK